MKSFKIPLFFIFSLAISFIIFILAGAVLHFAAKPVIITPRTEYMPVDATKNIKKEPPSAPQPAPNKTPPQPISPNPPASPNVVPKSNVPEALVNYSNQGFSPSDIYIASTPANHDCILRIINETDKPLIIRLSPHHSKDDWGFKYPAIPAQNSALIDPRYRIDKIAFHNFEKPEHEFSVAIDPNCLP